MSGRGLAAVVLFTFGAHMASVFGQGLPNLKPFQAFAWPDTLVVHTNVGQPVDTHLVREDQDLYVDWAVFNDGLSPATNRFYVSVFVDNSLRGRWFSLQLSPQAFTWVNDGNIGRLSPGFHTIRVEMDSNGEVEESDETDNSVEQQIAVTSTNIIPVRIFDSRTTPEGAFAFSFLGSLGRRYQVESSPDLTSWLPMEVVTNHTGIVPCSYPIEPGGQRSFRVRLVAP